MNPLPRDCLFHILSFVPPYQVAEDRLYLVCRDFYRIVRPRLVREKARQGFLTEYHWDRDEKTFGFLHLCDGQTKFMDPSVFWNNLFSSCVVLKFPSVWDPVDQCIGREGSGFLFQSYNDLQKALGYPACYLFYFEDVYENRCLATLWNDIDPTRDACHRFLLSLNRILCGQGVVDLSLIHFPKRTGYGEERPNRMEGIWIDDSRTHLTILRVRKMGPVHLSTQDAEIYRRFDTNYRRFEETVSMGHWMGRPVHWKDYPKWPILPRKWKDFIYENINKGIITREHQVAIDAVYSEM